MKYLLLTSLVILAGCSADKGKVQNVLQGEGCTNVVVGGWKPFCCDKHDSFTNTFSCTKNGVKVSGCVCSGILKGYTVRYQ